LRIAWCRLSAIRPTLAAVNAKVVHDHARGPDPLADEHGLVRVDHRCGAVLGRPVDQRVPHLAEVDGRRPAALPAVDGVEHDPAPGAGLLDVHDGQDGAVVDDADVQARHVGHARHRRHRAGQREAYEAIINTPRRVTAKDTRRGSSSSDPRAEGEVDMTQTVGHQTNAAWSQWQTK
jgi:hypothetical protein